MRTLDGPGIARQLDPTALLRDAPDAMLLIDADGTILFANRQTESVFGYHASDLVGRSVDVLLPAALQDRHRAHRASYAQAPSVRPMGVGLDLLAARMDGTTFPVEISLSPLLLDDRSLTLAAVRDVTRQRGTEQALRQAKDGFRLTIASSPVGIGVLRADGTWASVNPALCALAGRPEPELLRTTVTDLLPDGSLDLASGRRDERRLQRPDGTVAWVEITLAVLKDASGTDEHVVVYLYDVTERHSHQRELQLLAWSDPLTGLPNRTLLLDRTRQALIRLNRNPGRCALLILDLDHFKTVNDTLGHIAGDELLRQVARRLSSVARSSDTVARLGGDEFAVLCDGTPLDELAFAERLLTSLEAEFVLDLHDGSTHITRIGASIGVAVCAEHGGSSADDLYRDADVALYDAKARGRGRAQLFDPSLRRELDRRVSQESRLRQALADGGVRVLLQPIVALPDGEVVACEALARLAVPGEPGLILPAQFLPVAAERGLTPVLDEQVLRVCLGQLSTTRSPLHVNVSAATLEVGRWQEILFEAIEETPDLASLLCVELTEQALMSAGSRADSAIVEMRQRGVRVGLDDFGTGYSSLSYLERLPVDFLKLDTSLVSRVLSSHRSQVLTHGIISMSRELGLRVVAEGIEDVREAALLSSWGCDRGQGYLFGRPAWPAT